MNFLETIRHDANILQFTQSPKYTYQFYAIASKQNHKKSGTITKICQ
ncbi:hypothetical protein XBP1_1580010 [Xenorhabdus bovienii str. puntauvense]|nr:hypothetical protein XBP1_1580010 [Xenorhabdus bovienii str. puntauvense]CDH23872.1 hypothetical protein XBKB1_2160016 [Xenorhabdus bovienii str. kraussei Becker Underwood]